MKCVILQPSYIPWRGYFHQIKKADVFVFYDDVQFDKRGWRNRNRVKTPGGSIWLTIPVLAKGAQSEGLSIDQVPICWDRNWNESHLRTLSHSYAKAPFWKRYHPLVTSWYTQRPEMLADFTIDTTVALAQEIGITNTKFIRSSTLGAQGAKTDRLLDILLKLGATHHISGPSAMDYLETEKLAAHGISTEWMTYSYPEYPQLHPPFDPQVSILDLLFSVGPDAGAYVWG